MTATAAASRFRWRRWGVRLLVIGVGVYVGLAIMLAAFQTRLIFTGAASQGRADSIVRSFEGSEIVDLKSAGGEKIVAMFGLAETADGKIRDDAKSRPTLLYF